MPRTGQICRPCPRNFREGNLLRFMFYALRGTLYVLLAVSLLTACANLSATTPIPVTLRISGSTSMTPVLRDLARAYQSSHTYVLVDIRGGGSAVGLSELQAGNADLAAVSWRSEHNHLPVGLQAVPIARDAIAIVVHPHNTLPGLTMLQIRALYRGEALDWAALGGPAGEPVIISREDGSGTRAAFETLVMGGDRVTLNALVMPGTQAVIDYVASHRAAIGYASMAALTDQVRAVLVEGVDPTPANVRAGSYHLTRPLYLCTPAPVPAETQDFLDFVLSPVGQAIIARHHVPLRG